MTKAPSKSAITTFGGMPSVISGMNAPAAAALLAASGPATPSMAPVPKRSGLRARRRSSAYERNVGISAPQAGSDHDDVDAIEQLRNAECESCLAGERIDADQTENEAEEEAGRALQRRI